MFAPRNATVAALMSATALTVGTSGQVFRSQAEIVPVFVTVTDKDGRLVSALKQEDFEILDNGKPQPIALFVSAPQPISLVALLDMSGSMAENLPIVRRAVADFLVHLGPADQVRLGVFGQRIAFSPAFTRNAEQLLSMIPKTIPASAPTPLWRAVDEAMTVVASATSGRRVVLVLSDGKDSGWEPGQKLVTAGSVRARAQREDVMLYGVGLGSAPGPVAPNGVRALADVLRSPAPDPSLGDLAIGTGGGYTELRARDEMAATFARIADELHRQYLIGFVPPARDGLEHTVEVRVRRPDMTTQARKTYLAK